MVARSEDNGILGRKLKIFIRNEGRINTESKITPSNVNGDPVEGSQTVETDEKGSARPLSWREDLKKENDKLFKANDDSSEILTIYYQIKINGNLLSKEISFNHISLKFSRECLLWEFSHEELEAKCFSEPKLKQEVTLNKMGSTKEVTEFNIFINTDMLYPSLIQYIALNVDRFMDEKSLILVDQRDVRSCAC